MQFRYAIFCIAVETVKEVVSEQVLVLKPRPFGVGPAQEEIAVFDLFEDALTAPVTRECGRQPVTDLFGQAGRQEKVEEIGLQAVQNVRGQVLAYRFVPARQILDERGRIGMVTKRQ